MVFPIEGAIMDLWQLILASGVISALVSISFGLWRDRNLETLKGELRKEVFEHQTKFATHHDKRAEVIAELHVLLLVAHQAMRRLALPKVPAPRIKGQENSTPYDPVQDTYEARRNFASYSLINSIYLAKPQTEMVSEISELIFTAWINAATFRSEGVHPDWVESSKQEYEEAMEQFEEVKDRLETSFRETLEA